MNIPLERKLSRRDFLWTGALASAAGFFGAGTTRSVSAGPTERIAAAQPGIALPDLPYAYDALEPTIDARTMEIHHGRHHGGYVRNLVNSLSQHPGTAEMPLEVMLADIPALPEDMQTSVRNNGGGHWNHALFWEIMSPDGGGEPVGALADAINAQWGNTEAFQEEFNRAAATRFGSGWAWLLVDGNGDLQVSSTPNQDNPLMHGLVDVIGTPILGLDVWEHAYYLHYQNRRGDYIKAWWNVVNWPHVDALYRLAHS